MPLLSNRWYRRGCQAGVNRAIARSQDDAEEHRQPHDGHHPRHPARLLPSPPPIPIKAFFLKMKSLTQRRRLSNGTDWTGRDGLSRQRRGTRFYITDEQQAGGGPDWIGCSCSDWSLPSSPSFPFAALLLSVIQREGERRRWSGEASSSAERSDIANGWMGREAGAELMRWRAHSMGAVGARAASHRAPPPSAEAPPKPSSPPL